MKNKGFTLVELLAVVAILAIVAGLSMAVFTRVREATLNQELNNIKAYIETQAQNYAADTNITVINVEGLIQAGYVEPDDETDIYNPVTNESLNCFVVRTSYEEGEYTSVLDLDPSNNLMDEDGTCNFYEQIGDDLILIGVEQSNGTYLPANNSEWYGTSVNLAIINQENNEPFTAGSEISYLWQSHYGTTQTSSTITVDVAEGVASNIPYTAIINYQDEDGNNVSRTTSALINIDKENPIISPIDISDNDSWTSEKTVTITATDGNGSGLYGIGVFANQNLSECPTNKNQYVQVDANKLQKIIEENGTYQVCAIDNVNNVSTLSDDTTFVIDNIDKGIDGDITISASPTAPTNEFVTLTGYGEDEGSGIVAYKFNQTGDEDDGTWNTITGNPIATITQTQQVTQNGTYYFCIQDAIGNKGCSEPVTVDNIDKEGPRYVSGGRVSLGSVTVATFTDKNLPVTVYYLATTSKSTPSASRITSTNRTFSYSCGNTYYVYAKAVDSLGNYTIRLLGNVTSPDCCDEGTYRYDYCSSSGFEVYSRYNECTNQIEYLDTPYACEYSTGCDSWGECQSNGRKYRTCYYYYGGREYYDEISTTCTYIDEDEDEDDDEMNSYDVHYVPMDYAGQCSDNPGYSGGQCMPNPNTYGNSICGDAAYCCSCCLDGYIWNGKGSCLK